jgi:hypothetical protein
LQTYSFYIDEYSPPSEAVTPLLTPIEDGMEAPVPSVLFGNSSYEELVFLLSQLMQTYLVFQKGGFHKNGKRK